MLGLFVILPVFMLEGAALEGATPALLGFALGVYGLSQALMQVPFGLLSDRIGRKPVIIMGLVLFALGGLIAGLSTSVYGVILGRFLQGAGAIASVLMAFLSDLTQEDNRTKAMAAVGMTIGLTFAVSLILGPFLTEHFGLSGLFLSTVALSVAGAVVVSRLPNVRIQVSRREHALSFPEVSVMLRNIELRRLDFGIFALHFMLTATFVVTPKLLADRYGIEVGQHGWIYLAVMVTAFIGMVPFIIIGEKKQKVKTFFLAAVLLLAVSVGFLSFTEPSLTGFVICLFAFFLSFNFLEATLPSLISRIAPAGSRGTAMGIYSSSQFFGAFLGGAVGGSLFGFYGFAGVYGMSLLIALSWWVVGLGMLPPPNTKSIVLPLKPFASSDCERIASELQGMKGVEDVTLVVEEQAAYLKVNKAIFDDQVLMQHPLASSAYS
ncbi:MAG: MFS transporter [Hahellaceae bacterium]|nr:MFS transporter [Hahellaceae bacterium]